MRPPVLIIGAHRSGTSATARALEILGVQIGQRLDSHREPKALQQLQEEYLQQLGASWHNPAPFIESIRSAEGARRCADYLRENVHHDFARIFGYRKNPRGLWLLARLKWGAPWGWKEPRTTLFARAWLQIFPQARVIDVVRHPFAAAESIRQRELEFRAAGNMPTAGLDKLDFCLRLVLAYVEIGGQLAIEAAHYRRVRFEDIQARPDNTLGKLADFCGTHFTSAQLTNAVSTIRPQDFSMWDRIPEETAHQFSSYRPVLAKLGYEWKKIDIR